MVKDSTNRKAEERINVALGVDISTTETQTV